MDRSHFPGTCVCLDAAVTRGPEGDSPVWPWIKEYYRYTDNVTLSEVEGVGRDGLENCREKRGSIWPHIQHTEYVDTNILSSAPGALCTLLCAWECVCLWQQPQAFCVYCLTKFNASVHWVCVWEREPEQVAESPFCSASFLFSSFSLSKEICLKVAALCSPTAPEYNNRRSVSWWKRIGGD